MVRVSLLAILLFTAAKAAGGSPDLELAQKLQVRVSHYSLSAKGLADAVARVGKKFQLPVGVEWVRDKHTLRAFSLEWKGETLEGILRSIVRVYPGYAIRVEPGIIHVFSEDLVSDKHNFLNLKVPDSFEVRDEEGGIANQRLRSMVQNIVSRRSLPAGAGEAGSYATGIREKRLSLTLGGATVREALNSLVGVSEHRMWVVTFSASRNLTPTGYRRTESLWHPIPFPDSQQPMWDFLAWEGYPIPPTSVPPTQK